MGNNGGWWSLHLTKNSNWEDAIEYQQSMSCNNGQVKSIRRCYRNGGHQLLLKVPTRIQWQTDVRPELRALAQPWIQFAETCAENLDKIPYVIYYLDHFLGTFDNEFDCSTFVQATGIESQA